MKKLSLYTVIGAVSLLMASCTEDYTDWADPQTNPQEDAITLPGFSASAVSSAINLADVTDGDSVQAFTLSVPSGVTVGHTRMEITPADNSSETQTLSTSNEGKLTKEELQAAVVNVYGKRPMERSFNVHVYSDIIKNGSSFLIDAGTVNLTVTPEAPFISTAYYLVGDFCGWSSEGMIKFSHSDADVYEDPVFTVVFTVPENNNGNWKIIPQSNIDAGEDAFWNEGTTGVLGVAVDGDPALSGTLTTSGPKAGKVSAPGTYKMTINMMDYSFSIEAAASEYYVYGSIQSWNNGADGMTCMFYPQTATVQTYTTKWTGAWDLKIWSSAGWGNDNNAYGSAVDGDNSESGKLVTNGAAQAISAPSAEYYTLTIDMGSNTYKWTKLEDQTPKEYASMELSGDFNGWGGESLTQVTPHNWYAKVTIAADGALKFRTDANWTANWGADQNIADVYYGKGVSDGANITVPAGTYRVFFNDITGDFAFIAE